MLWAVAQFPLVQVAGALGGPRRGGSSSALDQGPLGRPAAVGKLQSGGAPGAISASSGAILGSKQVTGVVFVGVVAGV